jgi:outer membrane protein assembly factor BamB
MHILFIIVSRTLVVLALTISIARGEAREEGHLIPAGPNFDVDAPYAGTYARLCEKMLFTGPSWVIRYHDVSTSAETGLAITRKQDGKFWIVVKQTKPQLGSVVSSAFDLKLNLESALKTLKTEEAHAEIPAPVATAVRSYWTSLLSNVRPYKQSPPVISNKTILFAKTNGGKILVGRVPADSFKYPRMAAVEDIALNLIKVCVSSPESRQSLFDQIERKARTFRTAVRRP